MKSRAQLLKAAQECSGALMQAYKGEGIRKPKKKKKGKSGALAKWFQKADGFSAPPKKSNQMFEVYYIGKSGKKIIVQRYEDQAEANQHLKDLRKLYGKYIKAGVREVAATRFAGAVKKVNETLAKRKNPASDLD